MCFHSDRVTGPVMLYSSASASFVSHFSTKWSGSTSSKRGSALSSAFNFRATFASNTRGYPFISKGNFFISSPQDRSMRFRLYFPDRPVHSDTISASLGSIQPYATINARMLLVHTSTTVYWVYYQKRPL